MNLFKIDEHKTISCEHQNTRSGFRHVAVLLVDGSEETRTKACYSNRTWERYEFESVLHQLLDKATDYTDEHKKVLLDKWSGRASEEANKFLNLIGTVAKMGEVMTESKEEANSWKLRMIKAGLDNKGLSIPSDWEELSEDEKERRLDKVIEMTQEVKE